MKRYILLLLFLLGADGSCAQSVPQQPPNKEALLIANGDYSHFGRLPNPVSDAGLLAQSLQQIGFHVTLLENQSREGMLDALSAFQDRLRASRGLALFHYGGHGVQVNGKNFLIPVDADIPDERKVSTRAVDLEEVMTTLDASGSSVNVVVLDACRDNPLPATASRSATRGLSVIQTKPKNSLIVYAAEPGSKANDGLFTPVLAKALTVPGHSITEVMTDVRKQVYELSGGSQIPGEYNQLFDQVYLADGGVQKPQHVAPSMPPQPPREFAPRPTPSVQSSMAAPSYTIAPQQDRAMPRAGSVQSDNLEDVVFAYLRALDARDPQTIANSLGSTVDYYSMGYVSKSKALDDIYGDWKRYSDYHSSVSGFERTGPYSCQFILDYSLMHGSRQRFGRLLTSITVSPEIPHKIISLKAKVLSAK